MNFNQRQLVIWAAFVILYIFIMAALHWFLDSDVFIIALGLCGLVFMGEYYHLVIFSPLDRSIGRSEGELRCLKRIDKILKKGRK